MRSPCASCRRRMHRQDLTPIPAHLINRNHHYKRLHLFPAPRQRISRTHPTPPPISGTTLAKIPCNSYPMTYDGEWRTCQSFERRSNGERRGCSAAQSGVACISMDRNQTIPCFTDQRKRKWQNEEI